MGINPLITLSDTLIGAIVPEDAHDFEYSKNGNFIDYYVLDRGPLGKEVKFITLPSGKWEIVGEVTEKDIDPYFLKLGIYKLNIRSLLASKDIYWVNLDEEPYRKHYKYRGVLFVEDVFQRDRAEWQRKQSIAESMKGNKVVICAKID